MFTLKNIRFGLLVFVLLSLSIASAKFNRAARAVNPECANITISLSPDFSTYEPGSPITITVNGIQPANETQAWLHFIRSTASTSASPTNWEQIGAWSANQNQYEISWSPPTDLPGPPPYDTSNNQEFIIAFTLYDSHNDLFICTGNPDPGEIQNHLEIADAMCENCRKIFVTRQTPSDSSIVLADYWHIKPGYSFTYQTTRQDNPVDDHGTPIPANTVFTTRMEYEAPVEICDDDISVIPQRFTKNSRWAYWGPAEPQQMDRTGLWSQGYANLRFFLTVPQYEYPWTNDIFGAYGHKIYEVKTRDLAIGYLKGDLARTLIHTSRNHENYYYPPYLLSYPAGPDIGQDRFTRLDTLYSFLATDEQTAICVKQPDLDESHSWHMRMQMLTDTNLRSEFDTFLDYYGNNKNIYVLTFFEGGSYSGNQAVLREDWYLMEDTGLVGIDQASWEQDDSITREIYLNAQFMAASVAPPHVKVRAERAYLGGALQIAAISPGTTFPLIIDSSTGGCYTVGVYSITPGGEMPYDGFLEHNLGAKPALWRSTQSGNPPLRAANGQVTACLPVGFPTGTYAMNLRPYIMDSQNFASVELISSNESMLPYDTFPWSTNQLIINVISTGYKVFLPLGFNH